VGYWPIPVSWYWQSRLGEATCLDRAPSAQFYPVPLTCESRCMRAVTQWPGMPGSDGVAPEMGRVVVAFVQRMSHDRPLVASSPFAYQRGLAKAGRGRDESQFVVESCVQSLDQARARHQLWPGGGDIELCFQKGINLRFPPSTSSTVAPCPLPVPASGCSYRPGSAVILYPTG
jgi:hypothetical protein